MIDPTLKLRSNAPGPWVEVYRGMGQSVSGAASGSARRSMEYGAGCRRCLTSRRFLIGVAWITTAMTGPALAHTGEGGFVLLLPTVYYLLGGTLAVAASFGLVALAPVGLLQRRAQGHWRLCRLPALDPVVTSSLTALLLVILVVAGFIGNRDPLDNPLPLTIWTIWWVGLPMVQALFGNLWAYLNPWIPPGRLILRLLGRYKPALQQPSLPHPDWFGNLPA